MIPGQHAPADGARHLRASDPPARTHGDLGDPQTASRRLGHHLDGPPICGVAHIEPGQMSGGFTVYTAVITMADFSPQYLPDGVTTTVAARRSGCGVSTILTITY